MADALAALTQRYRFQIPPALEALCRALPDGADLGTVHLLASETIASGAPEAAGLTPALLPFALAQDGREAFALHVAPEPGARIGAVCAADLETGVYAPLAQTPRGWGAWLLLLRQLQAGFAAEQGGEFAALVEESAGPAFALARALGLEPLLGRTLSPDTEALANALRQIEPASPWACSWLAARAPGAEAVRRLSPALAAVPFAAGLLEQLAEALLASSALGRAVRSLLAALSRLEPNLQTAPVRLDEPDPQSGATFEPFQPVAAFWFLQEHLAEVPREALDAAPLGFLAQALRGRHGCGLALEPGEVIEWARRRGLGGDLPGGRWALHLAFAHHRGDRVARAALGEELSRDWELAGSRWYADRFAALARADRT